MCHIVSVHPGNSIWLRQTNFIEIISPPCQLLNRLGSMASLNINFSCLIISAKSRVLLNKCLMSHMIRRHKDDLTRNSIWGLQKRCQPILFHLRRADPLCNELLQKSMLLLVDCNNCCNSPLNWRRVAKFGRNFQPSTNRQIPISTAAFKCQCDDVLIPNHRLISPKRAEIKK